MPRTCQGQRGLILGLSNSLRNDLLTSPTSFLAFEPFSDTTFANFGPSEPSKSSIFIERVVIFEVSTFSVQIPSPLLLGNLLASILMPFQASWGGLGANFRSPRRRHRNSLPLFWKYLLQNTPRTPQKCQNVPPEPTKSAKKVPKMLPKYPQNVPKAS